MHPANVPDKDESRPRTGLLAAVCQVASGRWHQHAIHSGLDRFRADNHGQPRRALGLRRSLPFGIAQLACEQGSLCGQIACLTAPLSNGSILSPSQLGCPKWKSRHHMETSQEDQDPPVTSSSTSPPAAGWYPDPEDPSRARYWNGTAWTTWHRRVVPATPPPRFRPLATLARVVVVLLAAYFVVTVIAVVSDWVQLGLVNRLAEDQAAVTQAELSASDARQNLIGSLQLVLRVATGITFVIWFRRAYQNLVAMGTESLRFETGWTVGGWLVPFLNLVRPKQLMDDIWRATDPELPEQPGDAWRTRPVALLVHLWWAMFLLSTAVGLSATSLLQGASTFQELRTAAILMLIGDVLALPAAVLACLVVSRVTQRQKEVLGWWRDLSRSDRLTMVGVVVGVLGIVVGVLGIVPSYLAFFADGHNAEASSVASTKPTVTTGPKPEEQLLSYVGLELAADCEVAGSGGLFDDELVSIDCYPPDPVFFSLALYEDAQLMIRQYRASVPMEKLGSGDSRKGCQMGKPSEGRWYYGDNHTVQPAGRLSCYVDDGSAWLEWTLSNRRIYGSASREDTNIKALYSWWERMWSKKR
jgi:hypothetical protein